VARAVEFRKLAESIAERVDISPTNE